MKRLFLIAIALAILAGCRKERAEMPATGTASPAAAVSTSPASIINDPGAWVGKTVTVSGDVEEIWTPRAFNMDSGVTIGELLVISREPFANLQDRDPLVNDVATVTGTVRLLVIAEIEREIGWDLQPEIEAEFTGKPVLLVDNATFAPPSGAPAAASGTIPDLLIVVQDPKRVSLVGRDVRFTDGRVLRVAGDRSFFIGPSESESLLAVLAEGLDQPPLEEIVDVEKNQIRTLTGEIRRAPTGAEATSQMGLKPDDAAALERAGVYVHVTAIELMPRQV